MKVNHQKISNTDENLQYQQSSIVTRSMSLSNLSHSSADSFLDIGLEGVPLSSTTISSVKQQKRQDASRLGKYFVARKMNSIYKTEGCDKDLMLKKDLSINDCLKELLDFALFENSDRRKISNGTVLFDDLRVEEIITTWSDAFPTIKWLLQNFNHNIRDDELGLLKIFSLTKEKKQFSKQISLKEKKDLLLERRCAKFAGKFYEIINLLQGYNGGATSLDELHDKVKPILCILANVIDIPYSMNGECKLSIKVSEPVTGEGFDARKEYPVTCKPDFVFQSADDWLMLPVEVYTPKSSMDTLSICSKERVTHDMSKSQISHEDKKFRGQHTMQHICLLHKKMRKLLTTTVSSDLREQHISLGMFVNKEMVHFSKVKATMEHMSACITDLLPVDVQDNELLTRLNMRKRNTENGIEVVKSNWYLDLANGVHRNALLLFLVHYIGAYDVPAIICPSE